MPDLLVLVTNVVSMEGMSRIAFISWTTEGLEANGLIDTDFVAPVIQTNTTIVDAAKATQFVQNGVTFNPTDRVQLFGGRVSLV